MSARSKPEIRPEVRHVLTTLRTAIRVLGFTVRDVEKKLGYSLGYLSRVFSGMIELKVEHVLDISRALEMEPEEMMAFVYPELKDPPSTAAAELWKRMGGTAPTGTFIIRKQEEVPILAILPEAKLERALRRTLGRILGGIAEHLTPDDLADEQDDEQEAVQLSEQDLGLEEE